MYHSVRKSYVSSCQMVRTSLFLMLLFNLAYLITKFGIWNSKLKLSSCIWPLCAHLRLILALSRTSWRCFLTLHCSVSLQVIVYKRQSKYSRALSYYPASFPTYSSIILYNFSLRSDNISVFLFDFCSIFMNWQVYMVTSRLQYKLPLVTHHNMLCFVTSRPYVAFIVLVQIWYILHRC